jgi:hypothetical protein
VITVRGDGSTTAVTTQGKGLTTVVAAQVRKKGGRDARGGEARDGGVTCEDEI